MEARAPGLEPTRLGGGFTGCNAAVREGAAAIRGNVSPRAASGGPIHARLAPGNSAVCALRMLTQTRGRALSQPAALTRTALEACLAPKCWGWRQGRLQLVVGRRRVPRLADLVNETLTRG